MQKRIINFLILFMIFSFINIMEIKADSYIGTVKDTNVRVRSDAGTTYDELGKVSEPLIMTVLDNNVTNTKDSSTGCSTGKWYKVSYNNQTGYMCSEFLEVKKVETTVDFEKSILTFPESYRTKIRNLYAIYPNATFTPQKINIDFNTAVANEHYIEQRNPKITARSLIQTTSDGYKSTSAIVYNWSTNTWNTNISGGGSSWYAANTNTIAYYMDPRNFLTNNHIFMFLNHGYSTSIAYTESAINNILSGSFMSNAKTNDGTHTFARAFIDAGKESQISPYYLAARVIQEIGRSSSRSSYVSGSYNGYYNYYNINASGDNHLVNALTRAKNEGWNNDYKAIIGGAKFIADGYVSTGQTTLYLEKWDVVEGGNGLYSHQYMQNIMAPRSEGNTLYNTYAKNNLMNTTMEFLIPVYNNMPTSTSLPNPGNPNNYLTNLTINGATINGFNMDKLEYTINVSLATTKMQVDARKAANTSSISGIGTVNLEKETTINNVTVTAQNGTKKIYKITINRSDKLPIEVSEVVNTLGYTSDGTYIASFQLGTQANTVKERINGISINVSSKIMDKNGNEKTDTIKTGDKVKIVSGDKEKTYEAVIYGDVNGDGKISSSDYVYIKNNIMGTRSLDNTQKKAGDANKDGRISASDYVYIKNHIMGTNSIKQ